MTHFILGSGSPRRKEILNYFSLNFSQESSLFDESSIAFIGDPLVYATDLALGKLASLKEKFPEAIILTADTIVYFDGKIYNKPKDEDEAFRFLRELSGKWHSVYTALTLYDGRTSKKKFEEVEETKVLFNPLTPEEIRHYHSKIHWADKAGGYAIQVGAGLIVNRIDGCYYNVMGLPINSLWRILKHVDIDLWNHIT